MNLSPHFTLAEFTRSDTANSMGISNVPDAQSQANLSRVAQVMEQVRHLLGDNPITISSGYRCPQVNAAVGGSSSSAHLYGLACDFTCAAYGTPEQICKHLQFFLRLLGVDQLILEFDSWTHLGLSSGDPRCQRLTINDNGTETGFA